MTYAPRRAFVAFKKDCERTLLLPIFLDVCEEFGVQLEDVFSQTKTRTLVLARTKCWAQMRRLGHSFPEIGKFWGRDHSTVMAAMRKVVFVQESPPKEDPEPDTHLSEAEDAEEETPVSSIAIAGATLSTMTGLHRRHTANQLHLLNERLGALESRVQDLERKLTTFVRAISLL